MGDYPRDPVLQKPPGYRDPMMAGGGGPPPPAGKQAARKPPLPTSFRPKKKRRGCCLPCCCCICVSFLLLIFLLVVASAVFYLWFDPKLPSFSLASYRLDKFKLTPGLDGASLTASSTARVEMKNPNTKLVLYYGDTNVEVSVGQGNDQTGMGSTTVGGFKQGPRNATSLKVVTAVENQLVDNVLAKRLAEKFQSKELVVSVEAKSKVGVGVGQMKIGMLDVNLKCGGVSLNKLDSESPKCIINILKWINIH